MLVLFAVGLMNLIWMVLLTTVIFAEKVVPHGPLLGKIAGSAILISGVVMLAAPWLGRSPPVGNVMEARFSVSVGFFRKAS
jgi:hypothetical protein